jgi:uncharacterized membrane protein
MNRLYLIDNIRGFAFILMVIHHIVFFYDASNNFTTNYSSNIIIDIIGSIARTIFILLVGISLGLFNKKNKIKNRFKRSMEILVHGFLISITTYIFYPNLWIRFGVLHFIALTSFLCSFISRYKYLTIILFIISLFLKFPITNTFLDIITGSNTTYTMLDWFSLQKWLPLVLLGIIVGQNLNFNIESEKNILTYFGKNALNLYTIHVIFLIIFYYIIKKYI